MDTSFTNLQNDLASALRESTDWAQLTQQEQIRFLELEGYVVLPDLLSDSQLNAIRDELGQLTTEATDYSPHQRGVGDVQWTDSSHTIRVIALRRVIEFLNAVLGDDLVCTSCAYAVSEPGHPGIALHTDAQPYGSKIFGLQSSSPCLVRVLYYLDDLTPERSPFKVIPRSHLSLHADANPYKRYLSHKEEVMVTCPAGSAAIINQKVFHGNYPNYSNTARRMLAIAYRPVWAGPIDKVADHDPEKVAQLPIEVQSVFGSLNARTIHYDLPNRPDNMSRDAAGISPRRWTFSE